MRSSSPVLPICALPLLFCSSQSLAQPAAPLTEWTRVEGPTMTVGDVFGRLDADDPSAGSFVPKVIQDDGAYYTFVIPAAGSVQGAGGTYYRSDFSISNHGSATQDFGISFLAQGVDNTTATIHHVLIPARRTMVASDVVAEVLGKSGLGSIIVYASLPSGAADVNGRLLGFSRIWTNQPNASGTVSLQFPAVEQADSVGTANAFAEGLRHDAQYRTNVGIVNISSVPHTWTVRILGTTGSGQFDVSVLPFSMMQVPLPAGSYGDLVLDIKPTSGASNFNWSAYGASVDNITGDGWVSRALQP